MTVREGSGLRGQAQGWMHARGFWRWAFAVYALALFVGTHWPNLRLEVPMVQRPDLLVHMTIFAGWYGLFWLAGIVGPACQWRSALLACPIAVVYAGVDEGLQALPMVRRYAAWDDFGANALGVVSGCAAAMIVVRLLACSTCGRGVISGGEHGA